ncbi:hypothetical protein INR49_011251 [Caranx melampygus]|nr:hypothetical protein INR49_011251 [Caranx melampygus]
MEATAPPGAEIRIDKAHSGADSLDTEEKSILWSLSDLWGPGGHDLVGPRPLLLMVEGWRALSQPTPEPEGDLQRRHPSVESEESLGYHWGSWLGDGIQPRDGLTDGEEVNSLEPSLLLSLAGESAASSPAPGETSSH